MTMSISIRTIEKIVSDKLVIRTAAGTVTSIITTGSVERMNLKEGDRLFPVMRQRQSRLKKNSHQFGDSSAETRQASSVKTVESPNLYTSLTRAPSRDSVG